MTVNSYITLTNSNSSLSKKFKVVFQAYEPKVSKTQTLKTTTSGRLIVGEGAHRGMYTETLLVKHIATGTDPDGATYGTFDDLWNIAGTGFFNLKNPGGTPTNKIVMTDHYGNNFNIYIIGDWAPAQLSPLADGVNSLWYAPMSFAFADAL